MRTLLGVVAFVSASFLVRAFFAPPDYGRPPRLAAVVDEGKMEEFVETAQEKDIILRWVRAGAPETDWPRVAEVLEARCNTCHSSDASFEMLPLDDYVHASSAARVQPILLEKVTGGTMGEYLESREARDALVEWIHAGARESDWPSAKALLDAHCVHCHNPEGVQGIVSLESYRPVARLATLPAPAPRPIAVPAIALAVSLVGLAGLRALRTYRRRTKLPVS